MCHFQTSIILLLLSQPCDNFIVGECPPDLEITLETVRSRFMFFPLFQRKIEETIERKVILATDSFDTHNRIVKVVILGQKFLSKR